MEYQVIVGNIGAVYTGANRADANAAFREYRDQSAGDYGRAARETVTLLVDGAVAREYTPKIRLPLIKDIRALLIDLKADIDDEYRAYDDCDVGDTTPSMLVTIGADDSGDWSWQTGDNSYSGGAYGYPHWALVTLTRRANCTELARDAVAQIAELMTS